MSYDYHDANGVELAEGDRVKIAGWKPEGTGHEFLDSLTEEQACGRIVDIYEPDGDVDDEGRSIGIPPKIVVVFDDGEEDRFTGSYIVTRSTYWYEDLPFTFEDVEKIDSNPNEKEAEIS